jgi:hypothetical protein
MKKLPRFGLNNKPSAAGETNIEGIQWRASAPSTTAMKRSDYPRIMPKP